MASVWFETKSGGEPVKLQGDLHQKVAGAKFDGFVESYLAGKAGRKSVRYHRYEVLLFNSHGGLFGLVWVEFMSPPTAAEPGQPKRVAITKEK